MHMITSLPVVHIIKDGCQFDTKVRPKYLRCERCDLVQGTSFGVSAVEIGGWSHGLEFLLTHPPDGSQPLFIASDRS